ncbi:xanthan lyase [uncultured Bacteroides sp.]|uniref:golvesin C-terminal-like domain-containing protein n=1 Tax=uncultured Bacteroides sp. TaxID=162156 RepID=UPI002AA66273|nr:xanthan lyase [uncultured Bacteroides sp.]
MKINRMSLVILLAFGLLPQTSMGQELSLDVRSKIGDLLTETARKDISVGRINIDSVSTANKELVLFANINCSYIPFRENNVKIIYNEVQALLPPAFAKCKLKICTDNHSIEDLIPMALKDKRDKKTDTFTNRADKPLVTKLSVPYMLTKGLQNRHIALWQSHGFYYESKLGRWEWQRARIFQTVEDLYTQSYVLPFLVPMLENAGANVLIPRERDTQTAEVIIDNDGCRNSSVYMEKSADKSWSTGKEVGFAHLRDQYIDFENPFREGTYRLTETIKKGKESLAEWIPAIPKSGKYAVYVSYKTVENSTEDALYTIHHKGGVSQFKVNQTMGGGTWIYLGSFSFNAGCSDAGKVVLSNKSDKSGRIITADAVKIGGGYGNIARKVAEDGIATENIKSSDVTTPIATKQMPQVDYPYQTSGYPRFTEAARYWLQWAGMPDSIYSESHGKNDYTDDYRSRGLWVNYLAGGSSACPDEVGLHIPIDMAMAFHSDAGTTLNDSIVGTLGIFQTAGYNGVFADGTSRYASRDLADLIQTSIVKDIRTLYEPKWTRRGLWNQSYFEARVPKVPTMLLELLSHQNFADMRYGLDPRFRFTVSRAIYKGILQFLCAQYKQEYVVQPLPVDNMNIRFVGENNIALSWQPVNDPLELTAKADKYIVYTRIGNGDFDNGTVVDNNTYRTTIPAGVVCSYKVTALNKGGESFPSEILSVGRAFNKKGTVLVINGFDRVCAPADFVANSDSIAGFLDPLDHGVPYKEDISYIGSMKEFRRTIPWMDDDASGFGDSYGNYETMVIAGNTFDYPAVHGSAILKAGYSFVSSSNEAIENNLISLNDYQTVDLILGKERQTKMGRGGVVPLEFKTFSKKMQEAISSYCKAGGNIFVTGAYVASDLWDNPQANKEDKAFATDILKYKWRVGQAAITGRIKSVTSPYPVINGNYTYYNELNPDSYVVESPDALEPSTEGAYTVLRYSENNLSAGIAYKGAYKTCVLGFPFESIRTADEREHLMKAVLSFFERTTSDQK